MRSLRQTLTSLSPAIILATVLCGTISGQSALTTIQDTLFDADGARYYGSLIIKWSTFDTTNPGTIVQQSKTVQVVNGNLLVQLAPNSTATPPANLYTVLYQSDGDQQYSETWTVPASTTPLKVAQVRTGSGTNSSGSSGSSGSAGGLTGPLTEASVTNLISDLNARPIKGPGFGTGAVAVVDQNGQLETAVGNLGDCVFVDGTTGPCASGTGGSAGPTFVDGETPGGLINGLNATFTLANSPTGSSLSLYRNGILLQPGIDYTLTGSTIQFVSAAIPLTSDTLLADYRITPASGSTSGVSTGPSGAPGVNGCGAVGAAVKNVSYQIQTSDNGYLLVQSANAGLTLPVSAPPAGWCVVLLDTYTANIPVGNNGNAINGATAAYTLQAGNAVQVISDGTAYWLSGANGARGLTGATGATGPQGASVDRIFGSSAVAGTATTSLTLPSTNGCTPRVVAGTNVQSAVCTFANGTQQFGFGHFPIPATLPSVLYLEIKWRTTDTNASHSATFNWYYGSSSSTLDPALIPAGSVTTPASSISNQIQTSTIILASPPVLAGDEFYFYVSRRGDTDSISAGIDVVQMRIHN